MPLLVANEQKGAKDSCPIELAECAANNKVVKEPVFAWWVPCTLKKKARIISKIKSKHWEKTHKCSVRILKSLQDAIRLDVLNSNTS